MAVAHRGGAVAASDVAVAGLSAAALGAVCLGAASGETPDGPVLCPFRLATGLPCPFCGMTRSLFVLGQGRVEDSLAFAPLGPLIPLLALVAGALAVRALARRVPLAWPRPVLVTGVVVLALSWSVQLAGGVT